MTGLTAFDMFVLLLVGVLAVRGIMRGFVSEILSLMAWVAAILALRMFYEPATVLLRAWIDSETGAAIAAFMGVFLVTYTGFRLIAAMLGKRTRQSIVGPVDRLLGFGFGAVKGLIGASLLFLFAVLLFEVIWGKDEPRPRWMQAAKTAPLLDITARVVIDYVEEQRTAGADEVATTPATSRDEKSRDADGKGYSDEQRSALDSLFEDN